MTGRGLLRSAILGRMARLERKGCALALIGGCLLALLVAGGTTVLGVRLMQSIARKPEIVRIVEGLAPRIEDVSAEDRERYDRALGLQGQEGLDALSRLIDDFPRCHNLYYDRARLARSMGDLGGALGDYLHGTSLQQKRVGAYFPWDDSDVPPPLFVALLDLAQVYAGMGDVEAAIDTARTSLDQDPEHPYRPLLYIGNHQCDLGRFEEALPNFERALDREDAWLQSEVRVDALAGRARALHGLGRDEEALESYSLARDADWRGIDAELHFDMALVLLDAGDLAGAERSLGHAREIDPSNELVEEALRRVGARLDEERRGEHPRTREF